MHMVRVSVHGLGVFEFETSRASTDLNVKRLVMQDVFERDVSCQGTTQDTHQIEWMKALSKRGTERCLSPHFSFLKVAFVQCSRCLCRKTVGHKFFFFGSKPQWTSTTKATLHHNKLVVRFDSGAASCDLSWLNAEYAVSHASDSPIGTLNVADYLRRNSDSFARLNSACELNGNCLNYEYALMSRQDFFYSHICPKPYAKIGVKLPPHIGIGTPVTFCVFDNMFQSRVRLNLNGDTFWLRIRSEDANFQGTQGENNLLVTEDAWETPDLLRKVRVSYPRRFPHVRLVFQM